MIVARKQVHSNLLHGSPFSSSCRTPLCPWQGYLFKCCVEPGRITNQERVCVTPLIKVRLLPRVTRFVYPYVCLLPVFTIFR